ncbi:UNVERIFIED_CONTAM: hypothetical protein FKN15_058500 [Acipenser sinensis]
MAAVVLFLMRRHLALVEERQEHVRRRRARRRRPCIFNPRVTLFGMSEDVVLKCYRLTLQVILDLIPELRGITQAYTIDVPWHVHGNGKSLASDATCFKIHLYSIFCEKISSKNDRRH